MEVKINLNNENIHDILKINGYVEESILVHYKLWGDYIANGGLAKMGSYYMRVAYPEGQRPRAFENDIIMADDANFYSMENTINRLFHVMLLRAIGLFDQYNVHSKPHII